MIENGNNYMLRKQLSKIFNVNFYCRPTRIVNIYIAIHILRYVYVLLPTMNI